MIIISRFPKRKVAYHHILTFDTKMQLKRRSRSNQSWNIQDEIRKVRAKATEEMLKTVSPSSVASLEPKHSSYILNASLNVDGVVQGVFSFSFFTCGRSFSVIENMR